MSAAILHFIDSDETSLYPDWRSVFGGDWVLYWKREGLEDRTENMMEVFNKSWLDFYDKIDRCLCWFALHVPDFKPYYDDAAHMLKAMHQRRIVDPVFKLTEFWQYLASIIHGDSMWP